MSDKHVFISYLRDDKGEVDELQAVLEAADFSVWRDTKDLWPGDDWQLKIRQAIQNGSMVFLGCFSSRLAERETSYQYAELLLAAEEYRLRPMDTNWLITVRFNECEIPPIDLGGGRSLERTINRLDLFGKQKSASVARLVASIQRIIDATPGVPSPQVLAALAQSKRADGTIEELRNLLRNPSLEMDYDEYMAGLRQPVLEALQDRERFPMSGPGGAITPDQALAWAARIRDYEEVVAPLLEPTKLIAMYGQPGHMHALTQTMRAIGQECLQQEGLDFFRTAHQFPALMLTYVVTIAGAVKNNYRMVSAAVAEATVTPRFDKISAPFIARSGTGRVAGNWGEVASLVARADDGEAADAEAALGLLNRSIGARFTPISDHLFSLLAPLFKDQFGSDEEYARAFDRAEVLLDAISADAKATITDFWGGNGGYGRYTWRNRHSDYAPEDDMLAELNSAGAGWTPTLGGLFGGDPARSSSALEHVAESAKGIRSRQW